MTEKELPGPHQDDMDKELEALLGRDQKRLDRIPFPHSFDHIFNPHYKTLYPEDVEIIDEKGKPITENNVSMWNLLTFVRNDMDELEIQQTLYEQENPDWLAQNAMVKEAANYFHKHHEESAPDSVNISIQTIDGNITVAEGIVEDSQHNQYQYRSFERENIDDELDNADRFNRHQQELKQIAKTVTAIALGDPIQEDDIQQVKRYLFTKLERWSTKSKKNTDTFDALIRQVNMYQTSDEKFHVIIDEEKLLSDYYTFITPPTSYNHLGVSFESPHADQTVDQLKERKGTEIEPDSVNFDDLRKIVGDELTDIKDQYDLMQEKPDWLQQEQLLTTARWLFSKPENYGSSEIDITKNIDPENGMISYYQGQDLEEKTPHFKLKKADVVNAHELSFSTQISNLKYIEKVISAMNVGEPISRKEKTSVMAYLHWRTVRFETRKSQFRKGSPESKSAEANKKLFKAFWQKAKGYKTLEEITDGMDEQFKTSHDTPNDQ